MSGKATFDPVSFANTLDFPVSIYDSFSEQDNSSNYFGTLTLLATVPAQSTAAVKPIRDDVSVMLVSNATTNVPLARLVSSELFSTTPFGVGAANVQAMSQIMAFITLLGQSPDDPISKAFSALLKDTSQRQDTLIDGFFPKYPPYASCSFVTYMMGVTYMAELPKSQGQPIDQAVYSLAYLVSKLGGSWPPGFPDIVVTKFTCTTKDSVLAISAEIDVDKLPAQSDEALKFFSSLFKVKQFHVAVHFNYGFSMGVLGTRLAIGFDAIHVPCGGSASLTIQKPTISIDINPLFKFVVLTVTGEIPFKIFGDALEADVSMVIDNVEANFGVVIKGDHTSLPAPPVMKGVHFDEFGIGIGVFFEPPGVAIGLSGKLHIGQPGGFQASLDDDTFAVVCRLEEEIPNPIYISFYVPQMHLTDVLTVFTNAQTSLDVPVSFSNLSFKWSEDPMLPVALPDGSLSDMGYGFSAAANILAFSFYGDVEIDMNKGLTADIEMTAMNIGNAFSIGGTGKGVSVKVDASGSPIKNNQIATTAAEQATIQNAKTKQLVPPGGPVLKIQTFVSPVLVLNGHLDLFELERVALNAVINKSGITFDAEFGTPLTTKMNCTLTDWHNLAGSFQYGIDQSIQLPSVGPVSLGSLHLQALVDVHFSLSTTFSNLIIRAGGGFSFEGVHRDIFTFTVNAHIQKISDLLAAILHEIESAASQIFSEFLKIGQAWAAKVKQGVIKTANAVADVLHRAFNQAPEQIASTMKAVGYTSEEIANQLKNIFDPNQVADALKHAYNMSELGVAQVMKQAGYAGEVVAGALKNTFGGDAAQIASALKGAYGWSADQIQGVLGGIGFAANDIGNAFKSLGGDFASVGSSILDKLNPSNWANQAAHDLNPFNW